MTALADQLWEDAGTPLCEEFYGVSVILERGGRRSDSITAIADTVTYQVENTEGFYTSFTTRDYTLPVATTMIGSEAIEPRKGDRIRETINGVEQVFEVLPVGNDSEVSLTPTGTQWLVHTKRAE